MFATYFDVWLEGAVTVRERLWRRRRTLKDRIRIIRRLRHATRSFCDDGGFVSGCKWGPELEFAFELAS